MTLLQKLLKFLKFSDKDIDEKIKDLYEEENEIDGFLRFKETIEQMSFSPDWENNGNELRYYLRVSFTGGEMIGDIMICQPYIEFCNTTKEIDGVMYYFENAKALAAFLDKYAPDTDGDGIPDSFINLIKYYILL